jgi:5-(carboxyamino)imidazole ribonucleotide mutase
MGNARVAIVMGSRSDSALAEKAAATLTELGVDNEVHVISAHRNPNRIRTFVRGAEDAGFGVIIAIAGLAAHLPGVVASMTVLPVVGVPVDTGPLHGQDALYSIVQMPPGIPVASVGISNARNAALFAVQILGATDPDMRARVVKYREQFGDDPS